MGDEPEYLRAWEDACHDPLQYRILLNERGIQYAENPIPDPPRDGLQYPIRQP